MPTSNKPSANQFSILKVDMASDPDVERFNRLIWRLAWSNDNPNDSAMMTADMIASELYEELAKGLKIYKTLPAQEQEWAIKRMFDNRISELRYKYYLTHRKAEQAAFRIDDDGQPDLASDAPSPEHVYNSLARVRATRDALSETAQMVFDTVVLGEGERLTEIMQLRAKRLSTVYDNPTLKVEPWMVAEALVMPIADVKQAFKEIKVAYQRVVTSRED